MGTKNSFEISTKLSVEKERDLAADADVRVARSGMESSGLEITQGHVGAFVIYNRSRPLLDILNPDRWLLHSVARDHPEQTQHNRSGKRLKEVAVLSTGCSQEAGVLLCWSIWITPIWHAEAPAETAAVSVQSSEDGVSCRRDPARLWGSHRDNFSAAEAGLAHLLAVLDVRRSGPSFRKSRGALVIPGTSRLLPGGGAWRRDAPPPSPCLFPARAHWARGGADASGGDSCPRRAPRTRDQLPLCRVCRCFRPPTGPRRGRGESAGAAGPGAPSCGEARGEAAVGPAPPAREAAPPQASAAAVGEAVRSGVGQNPLRSLLFSTPPLHVKQEQRKYSRPHTPRLLALFTIAKIWKQSKCPSTGDWIYTMEYYSAIKKRRSSHLQQHGWTCRELC
ncbi:uncharacterized protein [Equus asinus]|uniref:uncharacterized protein n=1 Tax=Equus asinus TaxID=9793 RepID=UPI0038F6C363